MFFFEVERNSSECHLQHGQQFTPTLVPRTSRFFNIIANSVEIGNQFTEDFALQEILQSILPESIYKSILNEFTAFGERVKPKGDIGLLAQVLHEKQNEPKLMQYNSWGKYEFPNILDLVSRRIDEIIVHPAWKKLHDIAAEEGLISIGYERKYGKYRFYIFLLIRLKY